jgi:two-component system, cell cycle sensor histidine kinase and response regulator CckA
VNKPPAGTDASIRAQPPSPPVESVPDVERESRGRERYYRSLIDNTADLVTVLGPDGAIREQNVALRSITGHAPEEVIGHNVLEFVHPEDLAFVRAEMTSLLAHSGVLPPIQCRIRGRNGEWIYIEAHGRNLLADPAVQGLVIHSRDVTRRRQAEDAARRHDLIKSTVRRAAERFLHAADWRREIPVLVAELGMATDVELLWFVEHDVAAADGPRLVRCVPWTLSGSEPLPLPSDLLCDRADHGLPRAWLERLRRGDVVHGQVCDSAAVVSRIGAESVAAVPLIVSGVWWGTLLFGSMAEARPWDGVELDALRDAAELLGSVIQRQLADAARHQTQLQFTTLFEQAADAIAIHDLDGRLVQVNQRLCTLLGYPREVVVQMNVADLYIHGDQESQPDGRTEIAPGATFIAESGIRHRDGTLIPIERRASPIRIDGEMLVLVMIRDTSRQKRIEAALRDSEAWFRSLMQHALDIVTVLGPRGEIRYSSPSGFRQLGYAEDELLGRCIFDLLHPDDAARAKQLVSERIADGGAEFALEVRIRAKNGEVQIHEAVGNVLLADPAIQGIVLNSRDVTERRRLESELRQAHKLEAIGKLAGGIAHDFNNLLTAIKGHAQFALETIAAGDPVAEDIREIDRSAGRAAELTRQLLAFSRKQVLQPRDVEINELIAGMSRMLRRILPASIELVTDLLPGIGRVHIDAGQFEQVLLNLAINARDAMPDGGRLIVRTRSLQVEHDVRRRSLRIPPNRYVLVSVVDTGSGMDSQLIAKIFEPFFTTKDAGQGTGLGLSMVYGVVEQSGGFIEVDSERGRGSTFTIYLPEDDRSVPADEAAADPAGVVETVPAGRATVLLVEDEAPVRTLARKILERKGYRVLQAGDAAEALRLANAHLESIDLLLSDVVMPGMSGQLLADQLVARRPGLRVLFMSGYSEQAIMAHGVLREGVSLLAKPFSPDELVRHVQQSLDDAS